MCCNYCVTININCYYTICLHYNKCSSSIFNPINIKIVPPNVSALLLYLSPNTFPILTPIIGSKKDIIPIIVIDNTILFTANKEKVIPSNINAIHS